jgi:hypothetical protein
MAWWDDLLSLNRAAADWLDRTSSGAAGALNRGGERLLPGSTPAGAPGAPPAPPAPPVAAVTAPAAPGPSAAGTRQVDPSRAAVDLGNGKARTYYTDGSYEDWDIAQGPPRPATSTLQKFQGQLNDVEQAILTAEQAIKNEPGSTAAYNAQQALPALRTLRTQITTQIAQEENRIRDEQKKAETEEAKPKNGDTRTTLQKYTLPNGQTVQGVITETYNNGQWSYVNGSAKPAEGWLGQAQGPAQLTNQVLTDGRGGYWTYDQATGDARPINGPAGAVKTISGPDGGMYVQNPDGSLGNQLFEGLPQTYTDPDGYVIGIDRRNGAEVFRVDTKTKAGRELSDRIARAKADQAEREAGPQFQSAVAQYQSEVGRRQGLARTELARLQDLQKSGQLSPDQAEAQFDAWMQTNVEGPLAGYRAAAEEERRTQEQANLTRQTAEDARVEALNRQRQQLGYQAGEAARQQGIEIGQQTRAPQYLQGLGDVANAMATGRPFAGFSPEAFNPANFKGVQPDYNALADQAMNRLFGVLPQATARNVNVPLPQLPTGDALRTMLDGVRYSGPLTGTPNEAPVPGQEAQDLGTGMARTMYPGNRFVDWRIPA